jgi:demethylmenaquinone methyltransferase/2-methoxy-6-polyprenyl-1,4-benzoquinol methylase
MDHFRFLAPVYDRLMGAPDINHLRAHLRLPADGRLLDVGGGTGRASFPLRGLTRGTAVCDVSPPMLRRARRKGSLAVCAPAERLPFPDRSFARVLAVDALHHFRDAPQAVAEMARVLAPGGRLALAEFDLADRRVRWLALAEALCGMRSRFYTAVDIGRMLSDRGLTARIERGRRLTTWVVADT